MSTLPIPLPCSWSGRTLTLTGHFAVVSGPWVNPPHGRGPRDQVTALVNRGTCCLLSDMVRHEVVVEPDGTVDVGTYPEGKMLADLEFHNKICCNILTLKGSDDK